LHTARRVAAMHGDIGAIPRAALNHLGGLFHERSERRGSMTAIYAPYTLIFLALTPTFVITVVDSS
jgi:hypothetical protein